MSYFTARVYKIIPTETYRIIHNCAGCGGKSTFQSTNKFRVNANGKQLDVWLIYQCSKCKHTYNISIYSRVNRSTLRKTEYEKLMQNDPKIVSEYGMDRNTFKRNGLIILEEPTFILKDTDECTEENTITIRNPYQISIRYDNLIAECLSISRSEAKKVLETGFLSINKISVN